jgi:hypothetical protein
MTGKRWIGRFVGAACAMAFAALIPAGPAFAAETRAANKAAFDAACGRCHGPRDIAYWGQTRRDAEARGQWLETFLMRHYPPPAGERGAIIRHIQTIIAEGTQTR